MDSQSSCKVSSDPESTFPDKNSIDQVDTQIVKEQHCQLGGPGPIVFQQKSPFLLKDFGQTAFEKRPKFLLPKVTDFKTCQEEIDPQIAQEVENLKLANQYQTHEYSQKGKQEEDDDSFLDSDERSTGSTEKQIDEFNNERKQVFNQFGTRTKNLFCKFCERHHDYEYTDCEHVQKWFQLNDFLKKNGYKVEDVYYGTEVYNYQVNHIWQIDFLNQNSDQLQLEGIHANYFKTNATWLYCYNREGEQGVYTKVIQSYCLFKPFYQYHLEEKYNRLMKFLKNNPYDERIGPVRKFHVFIDKKEYVIKAVEDNNVNLDHTNRFNTRWEMKQVDEPKGTAKRPILRYCCGEAKPYLELYGTKEQLEKVDKFLLDEEARRQPAKIQDNPSIGERQIREDEVDYMLQAQDKQTLMAYQ